MNKLTVTLLERELDGWGYQSGFPTKYRVNGMPADEQVAIVRHAEREWSIERTNAASEDAYHASVGEALASLQGNVDGRCVSLGRAASSD